MKSLKKVLTGLIAALAVIPTATFAQSLAEGQITVRHSKVKKDNNLMNVSMNLDLTNLDISSNEGVVLIPMLINGNDTVKMPAAEIYGRKRYIYYQRNNKTVTNHPGLIIARRKGQEQIVAYNYSTPYKTWMNHSRLVMGEGACGCDQTELGDYVSEPLKGINLFSPDKLRYAYIQPRPEAVKHRAVSGSARLNFVLDKYDIRPNFGNNNAELRKIRETIDLVRNDADVKLTGIELHGYASPDGKYTHNEELAANRTRALRNYLQNYYSKIDNNIFTTYSTAEDWEGVRRYFTKTNLPEREDLLRIIDSNLTPDEKDRAFAAKHGPLYKRLILPEVYPALRRTDYKVTYNVRNFNLDEARRIIKERPQKLSLQEMYRVANSYPKGSDNFNQVFDIAVRMFPEDELANLNAANVALSRGDKISAAGFLKKAGNTPESMNARGILDVKLGKYEEARQWFKKAAAKGLPEAKFNLTEMSNAE